MENVVSKEFDSNGEHEIYRDKCNWVTARENHDVTAVFLLPCHKSENQFNLP